MSHNHWQEMFNSLEYKNYCDIIAQPAVNIRYVLNLFRCKPTWENVNVFDGNYEIVNEYLQEKG